MKAKLMGLMKDEEGQGMVEYGLIIGLVAIVLMAALTTMSGGIGGVFSRVNTSLGGIAPAPAAP